MKEDYILLNPTRKGLETEAEFKQTGDIVKCFDELSDYLQKKWFDQFDEYRDQIVKETIKREESVEESSVEQSDDSGDNQIDDSGEEETENTEN